VWGGGAKINPQDRGTNAYFFRGKDKKSTNERGGNELVEVWMRYDVDGGLLVRCGWGEVKGGLH